MASLLAIGGAALINALAFSGTNFLFGSLSNHGAAERKRHDLAIEHLQKAQQDWVRKRQNRLDFINQRLRQQNAAAKYIKDLDDGMRDYYLVTGQKLQPLPSKPVLSDFYHPSAQQQSGEMMFIAGGLGLLGFVAYKYV